MYGRLDQVGKPLKCPDCGAQTILPPPPPEKPKKPLAAMEGDQYELWGVDEAPSVAEMLAAQPKYIAVECRMCQTLMHATEKQVGKKLKCPDCGTANLVPPPAAARKPISVLTRDDDDLQIDAALDPGERPPRDHSAAAADALRRGSGGRAEASSRTVGSRRPARPEVRRQRSPSDAALATGNADHSVFGLQRRAGAVVGPFGPHRT